MNLLPLPFLRLSFGFLFFFILIQPTAGGVPGRGKNGEFLEKQVSLDIVRSYSFSKNRESRNYFLIQPPPVSKRSHLEDRPSADPPSWFLKTTQGGGTKDLRYLILTVNVYDQEFSKITWEEDGSQFTAYCRMDFSKLKPLQIEGNTPDRSQTITFWPKKNRRYSIP